MPICRLKMNMAGSCGPEKPTNSALAVENKKKMDALLAERAKQDIALFGQHAPLQTLPQPQPQPQSKPQPKQS